MMSYLYKEYLQWINQIQLFRRQLTDIKLEVLKDQHSGLIKDNEKAKLILATVLEIGWELDNTDYLILTSLNNERLIWDGKYNNFNVFSNNNGDQELCLFTRMERHFNTLLKLQKEVTVFLSENSLADNNHRIEKEQPVSKIIRRAVSLSGSVIL